MKSVLVYSLLMFFALGSFAQSNLNTGWEELMGKGESYQNYKVIKKTDLNDFWKIAQDSLSGLKKELSNEKIVIVQQKEEIASLDGQVKNLTTQLADVSKDKEQISFIGIKVNKHSYVNILWIAIGIVLAGAAVLYFLYFNAHQVTSQKINEYDHLFNQFEEYKKNTIEKERKLKRELQTQFNLIEELKNRKSKIA